MKYKINWKKIEEFVKNFGYSPEEVKKRSLIMFASGFVPNGFSDAITEIEEKEWHHYLKLKEIRPKIKGKYLFFSEFKEELEKIAINELERGEFLHAKINTDVYKAGKDYVLCLYYSDDSKKTELATKYKNNKKVAYRFWKSDNSTRQKIYSEEYLNKLSLE
jgi:hypothetical protein